MSAKIKVALRDEDLGVFDVDDVTMDHALMFENKTGLTLGELGEGLTKMSARSLQALVWLQRVRHLGQLDASPHENFRFGDLAVEVLPDEEEADPTEAALAAEINKISAKSAINT